MRILAEPERSFLDPSTYGLAEIVAIGRYHYTTAHAPLRSHLHAGVYEICYLERGSQVYVVGRNDSYRLVGGDVFITRPGEVHGTGSMPECPGRLYWLQFVDPRKKKGFLGLNGTEAEALGDMLSSLPRQFRGGAEVRQRLQALFQPLEKMPRPLRAAALRTRLLELLFGLGGIAHEDARGPMPVGISVALHHMRECFEEPFSVSSVARMAHMSESYFKAAFTSALGMPPASYMRLIRLEHACRQLRTTSRSATDIGIQLGFSSGQHFATAFRKQYGITPVAFRHFKGGTPTGVSVGSGVSFHPVAK